MLFAVEPIEFRVAAPDSKKNRRIVVMGVDGPRQLPNPIAMRQEAAIRGFLEQQLGRGAGALFGDDDVAVEVTHHARSDEVTVRVEPLRPRPKKFAGRRRDLANLNDVLLDAMQGPVYANDNQVAELRMARRLD